MTRSTTILAGALLLSLLTGACAGPTGTGEEQAALAATSTPIPTAPAIVRPTYTVQRGDVQEILNFTGRWQPRDQMPLSFEINGTVRRVNVRRGDTVSAGGLLVDYQITTLEDQLASAQLNLENALSNLASGTEGSAQSVADAEIQLANARLSLESTRNSSPWTSLESARIGLENARQSLEDAQRAYDDAISRPDQPASTVDNARQQLQNAQNSLRTSETSYYSSAQSFNNHQYQVDQAENQVIQAELALENARSGGDASGTQAVRSAQLNIDQINADIARSSLYAPIDGIVLEVTINPGDAVQAYTSVITIGRPQPSEIIANLAIGDAQQLSVGMVGTCEVMNQPETAVQCAVRQIPLSSRDADQTTRIAASLDQVTDVATNQLVEVDMPLRVSRDVLWLPPAAIRTFQNRTFVVLDTPDGQRSVDVEIGLETDDRVEIINGVQESDIVVGP